MPQRHPGLGLCRHTRVANTSVVNLDADLVGAGRSNLDILKGEFLASLPGDGGLAGNGLSFQMWSVWLFPESSAGMPS